MKLTLKEMINVLEQLLDSSYDATKLEIYLENYILDSEFYIEESRYLNNIIDSIYSITHHMKNPNNSFTTEDLINEINRVGRPDFNLRRDFSSISNQIEYRFDLKTNAEGIYDELVSVHSNIVKSYENYNDKVVMSLNNNAEDYMNINSNKNSSIDVDNKKEVQAYLVKLLNVVHKFLVGGYDDVEMTLATGKVDIDMLLNDIIKGEIDYMFNNSNDYTLEKFLTKNVSNFYQIIKVIAEAKKTEKELEESEKASSRFM